MGYIFDAITRANQGQAPSAPPTASPAPRAAEAAPILAAVGPQTDATAPATPVMPLPIAGSEAPKLQPELMQPVTDPSVAAALAKAAHAAPGKPLPEASLQLSSHPDIIPAKHTQSDIAAIDERLVTIKSPAGGIAEEYRAIRSGILARWQNKRHLVHVITSALPQEGKTITSLNLGLSFAELRNRRTLVIEADLRLPQFARLLKLGDTPGLTDVLDKNAELEDVVHEIGDTQLQVIPAGRVAGTQAVQLLSTPMLNTILAKLRRRYDHIIIDTPPIIELADAGVLGAQADDVLLAVRLCRTPRQLVDQAVRKLQSYNAPVTGMLATDRQQRENRYAKYSYRYGHRYTQSET